MSRLPHWLKKTIPKSVAVKAFRSSISASIHTVCESALCPNRGECYSRGSATFLLLGDLCTRKCTFCAINAGDPGKVDKQEPARVAAVIATLNLRYVVLTSVTRDDIADGGAGHYIATIKEIHKSSPQIKIEVLTPDFGGNPIAIQMVMDSGIAVFNHNVETVPRLYPQVRPQADYQRSLAVLNTASGISRDNHQDRIKIKSGLMVGLGETTDEVAMVLTDLKTAGVDIVTIGQYLPPSRKHYSLHEYIHPDQFAEYQRIGLAIGFTYVFSAPLVRSSYRAEEIYGNPQT